MNLRITNSNQNFVIGFNKIKGAFLYQNPNPDFLCKNGRIFRFFTKIQKRIIDPNDPQWRWILWIISKTGYFGYMIRNVSLLRIRKEWIQPAVTPNNFDTYSSWSLRPFLNSRHGLNDRCYRFYGDGKIAIDTGPTLH